MNASLAACPRLDSTLEGQRRAPTHIGSSAVVQQASKRGAPKGPWLEQMLARKPRMLVTVALANKMARIFWVLLIKQENYKAPVAARA
jgi:transposase